MDVTGEWLGWGVLRCQYSKPSCCQCAWVVFQKERKNFEGVLKDYLSKESITINWETIKTSDDEELVNAISMGCPFDTNEKQALLEAKSLSERIKVLISLMQMSLKENKSTKPKSFS